MHENQPVAAVCYFRVSDNSRMFAFAKFFPGDANRQISDFKFKLVKAEQEVTALEQNVS